MKISRNTKLYYSDSEIKKRQEVQIPSKLKTKRTLSSKISSDDPTPLANTSKKHLFSSNISFKTAVYQLLSEEVYDDLISFLFILMSLPVIILKRIFLVLSWLYKQFDHIFLSSLNKMNKMLDEKKKSSFEQRRFSKNTKLEIYFKKKQIEERSKLCKENKLDLVLDLDETLINCRNQKPSYKSQEIEVFIIPLDFSYFQ